AKARSIASSTSLPNTSRFAVQVHKCPLHPDARPLGVDGAGDCRGGGGKALMRQAGLSVRAACPEETPRIVHLLLPLRRKHLWAPRQTARGYARSRCRPL